ncbi:MAG: hypothetical protein QME74_04075 [Candidatus Edwardsbacteria bacterium]|nr:hypothetical protein [Candidatus Edwardsbacteria bacterium]
MRFLPILILGVITLLPACSRNGEFRAQAQAGQPIIRAIEEFRKQTGSYPASLADLVPKYLPAVPDVPDASKRKFEGWEYHTVTNNEAVSYSLRYYMGKGGVEYEPPNWVGNDEGRRTVILSKR